MRILHILPFNEYGKNFISLLERNQDNHSHTFYITNQELDGKINHKVLTGLRQYFDLYFAFLKFDKVFCHGLFNNRHNVLFLFVPFKKDKFYWVVWGGDLYFYKHKGVGFKDQLGEFVRKLLFKKIIHILTGTVGDYDLVNQIYSVEAKHHNIQYYLPIHFLNQSIDLRVSKIMIGNSASSTNNHYEIIERVKREVDLKNMKFYLPLSYGDKAYAEEIIKFGEDRLHEYFVPIIEYMHYDDYIEFLKTINVAIMYHDRQQAFGNIIQLLALGKKVYIRSDTTHYSRLVGEGFILFDAFDDLSSISIPISLENSLYNIELVKRLYSEEQLFQQWSNAFDYQKGASI